MKKRKILRLTFVTIMISTSIMACTTSSTGDAPPDYAREARGTPEVIAECIYTAIRSQPGPFLKDDPNTMRLIALPSSKTIDLDSIVSGSGYTYQNWRMRLIKASPSTTKLEYRFPISSNAMIRKLDEYVTPCEQH